MSDITAIIGVGPRWRNIPIIVNRLLNQTCKPEHIMVWHDYHDEKHVLTKLDLGLKNIPNNIKLTIVNCTENKWTCTPQWVMVYYAETKYVAIIDDDKPMGPLWFEHCLKNMKHREAVYGAFGYRIADPNELYADDGRPQHGFLSELGDGTPLLTDHCGQSVFFKSEWIKYFFREHPPFHVTKNKKYRVWGSTEDLRFAHMLNKYGDILFFVCRPRNPEELPDYLNHVLIHKFHELAVHQRGNHRVNRQLYVRWAYHNGWELKFLEK